MNDKNNPKESDHLKQFCQKKYSKKKDMNQ